MLSREEIEGLARGAKELPQALDGRLAELKSRGAGILDCIKYVYLNQECSLNQAKGIVVNSSAWAELKDDFLRYQEEMFEEFLADNKDRIESLEMSITPDGTEVVARMKTPDENTAH